MSIVINSHFDGGNIRCTDCDRADNIRLNIEADEGGEFYQWFYFRMTAQAGCRYQLHIDNAGTSSYPKGWNDYRVVASYDRQDWFRIDTEFSNDVLSCSIDAISDVMWFAYFTPYSMQRHDDYISYCACQHNCSVEVLGQTLDGRNIDLLRIGSGDKPLKIWAIGRQHPGETMAQWWMEGYINRLLDHNDAVSAALLDAADFYIVPNMNPDGSVRGFLRTNAAGVNLNREWDKATPEHSPEVYCVLEKMRQTGVSFNLDVHGDEALPYNFIAGTEGIHSWNDERKNFQELFKSQLMSLNPDFQTTVGYPVGSAGTANYGICSSFIAEHFGCPAMTLEMPFKDNVERMDTRHGWSSERSQHLGASCVAAIYSVIDQLS